MAVLKASEPSHLHVHTPFPAFTGDTGVLELPQSPWPPSPVLGGHQGGHALCVDTGHTAVLLCLQF